MKPIYQGIVRVHSGGELTVALPDGYAGKTVEVVVTSRETGLKSGGILDYLESLPKRERDAAYWEEREREFQAERDSWDR